MNCFKWISDRFIYSDLTIGGSVKIYQLSSGNPSEIHSYPPNPSRAMQFNHQRFHTCRSQHTLNVSGVHLWNTFRVDIANASIVIFFKAFPEAKRWFLFPKVTVLRTHSTTCSNCTYTS